MMYCTTTVGLNNYGLVPQKLCIKIHLSSLLVGYLKHLSPTVESFNKRKLYSERKKRFVKGHIYFLRFSFKNDFRLKKLLQKKYKKAKYGGAHLQSQDSGG